jgi:drug/metabolite transporter (DMT)-like permease
MPWCAIGDTVRPFDIVLYVLVAAVWGSAFIATEFALLAPCAGLLGSMLVFGERVGPLRMLRVTLILLGLAATVLSHRTRP